MDQNAVVAAVSAVVSFASVVANLFIAHKSRQATIELEEVKAALKRAETAASTIKDLEIEAERLRIRSWEFIGVTSAFGTNPTLNPDQKLKLEKTSNAFVRQAEAFLDRWAQAKTELPSGIQEVLRIIRHRCRKQIAAIRLAGEIAGRSASLDSSALERLHDGLSDLLAEADRFIDVVSTVRRAIASHEACPDHVLFLEDPKGGLMRELPNGDTAN